MDKRVNVVNLTPHEINIITESGTITFPPSGIVARVAAKAVETDTLYIGPRGMLLAIPVTTPYYSDIEDLPEPCEGTAYIVSSIVATRCKYRNDVFAPGELVRDDTGKVIGCKALAKF